MDLAYAQELSGEILARLSPFCSKIQVAGSIRRKQPKVRDVDIVLIPLPSKAFQFMEALWVHLGVPGPLGKVKRFLYRSMWVDLYFATEATWATMLLIRTGSKESNIKLCALAKSKGWHLHANGNGLFDGEGKRIAGDSEQSIFKALGLEYKAPEQRS